MLAGSGPTTMAAVPGLLQTYENPIPGDGNWFGTSVATVGSHVVVGAGYHDILLEDDGAVYLFDADTGELRKTIHHPTPHTGDQLGRCVTSMNDYRSESTPSHQTTLNSRRLSRVDKRSHPDIWGERVAALLHRGWLRRPKLPRNSRARRWVGRELHVGKMACVTY